MQHQPHVGSGYRDGIDDKRIAVMGYSHHSDEPDTSDATRICIKNVEFGEWNIAFFSKLAAYFGHSHETFWSKVAFLNFLPRIVGTGAERFANGTSDAVSEGKERVISFLEEHKPDLLFVFSRKAWSSLPKTLEKERGAVATRLLPQHDFEQHHYRLSDGHVVQAIALRHPQGAATNVMKEAVAAARSMKADPPE